MAEHDYKRIAPKRLASIYFHLLEQGSVAELIAALPHDREIVGSSLGIAVLDLIGGNSKIRIRKYSNSKFGSN